MTRMALHWQILLTMLLGALLGIVLNSSTGTWQMDQPREHAAHTIQRIGMSAPVDVPAGRLWSRDTPERILLQIDDKLPEGGYRTRRVVVGERHLLEQRLQAEGEPWPPLPDGAEPVGEAPRTIGEVPRTIGEVPLTIVPTLEVLEEKDPAAHALFEQYGRSRARFVGDGMWTCVYTPTSPSSSFRTPRPAWSCSGKWTGRWTRGGWGRSRTPLPTASASCPPRS